jgi:hypothetical protein
MVTRERWGSLPPDLLLTVTPRQPVLTSDLRTPPNVRLVAREASARMRSRRRCFLASCLVVTPLCAALPISAVNALPF